jgi:DNA-binding LacI/PurR family transcriptional regulator
MNPDSDMPRVSLRDIAARLGVSHSTVSLSLRDHPRISQAVKERVRRTSGEMGYRPDPMLAALANYRRGRENHQGTTGVAWINGWQDPEELRQHPEIDWYWQGAFMAAEKSGFRLEEFWLGGECSPQRLHQILSTRGIRGILLPPHPVAPDWQDFPWNEYTIVRLGCPLLTPECHIVTADPIANTMLAVRAIHGRGYRRIGFVMLEADLNKRGMRFDLGFLGGQRLIRDEDPVPVLFLGGSNTAGRKEAFEGWLCRHKPDAILTPDPAVAELVNQTDLRVPEDIGLAVTSIHGAGADAGIDPHPGEIGRVGFLLLHSLMNDRMRGIPPIFSQVLVEGSWVDGESLPDRNAAGA